MIKLLSIASERPSGNGSAVTQNLLCLFADLHNTVTDDFSKIVSLYDTTGSVLITSVPTNSHKSLYKISTCNSPEPAMICSPDSAV